MSDQNPDNDKLPPPPKQAVKNPIDEDKLLENWNAVVHKTFKDDQNVARTPLRKRIDNDAFMKSRLIECVFKFAEQRGRRLNIDVNRPCLVNIPNRLSGLPPSNRESDAKTSPPRNIDLVADDNVIAVNRELPVPIDAPVPDSLGSVAKEVQNLLSDSDHVSEKESGDLESEGPTNEYPETTSKIRTSEETSNTLDETLGRKSLSDVEEGVDVEVDLDVETTGFVGTYQNSNIFENADEEEISIDDDEEVNLVSVSNADFQQDDEVNTASDIVENSVSPGGHEYAEAEYVPSTLLNPVDVDDDEDDGLQIDDTTEEFSFGTSDVLRDAMQLADVTQDFEEEMGISTDHLNQDFETTSANDNQESLISKSKECSNETVTKESTPNQNMSNSPTSEPTTEIIVHPNLKNVANSTIPNSTSPVQTCVAQSTKLPMEHVPNETTPMPMENSYQGTISAIGNNSSDPKSITCVEVPDETAAQTSVEHSFEQIPISVEGPTESSTSTPTTESSTSTPTTEPEPSTSTIGTSELHQVGHFSNTSEETTVNPSAGSIPSQESQRSSPLDQTSLGAVPQLPNSLRISDTVWDFVETNFKSLEIKNREYSNHIETLRRILSSGQRTAVELNQVMTSNLELSLCALEMYSILDRHLGLQVVMARLQIPKDQFHPPEENISIEEMAEYFRLILQTRRILHLLCLKPNDRIRLVVATTRARLCRLLYYFMVHLRHSDQERAFQNVVAMFASVNETFRQARPHITSTLMSVWDSIRIDGKQYNNYDGARRDHFATGILGFRQILNGLMANVQREIDQDASANAQTSSATNEPLNAPCTSAQHGLAGNQNQGSSNNEAVRHDVGPTSNFQQLASTNVPSETRSNNLSRNDDTTMTMHYYQCEQTEQNPATLGSTNSVTPSVVTGTSEERSPTPQIVQASHKGRQLEAAPYVPATPAQQARVVAGIASCQQINPGLVTYVPVPKPGTVTTPVQQIIRAVTPVTHVQRPTSVAPTFAQQPISIFPVSHVHHQQPRPVASTSTQQPRPISPMTHVNQANPMASTAPVQQARSLAATTHVGNSNPMAQGLHPRYNMGMSKTIELQRQYATALARRASFNESQQAQRVQRPVAATTGGQHSYSIGYRNAPSTVTTNTNLNNVPTYQQHIISATNTHQLQQQMAQEQQPIAGPSHQQYHSANPTMIQSMQCNTQGNPQQSTAYVRQDQQQLQSQSPLLAALQRSTPAYSQHTYQQMTAPTGYGRQYYQCGAVQAGPSASASNNDMPMTSYSDSTATASGHQDVSHLTYSPNAQIIRGYPSSSYGAQTQVYGTEASASKRRRSSNEVNSTPTGLASKPKRRKSSTRTSSVEAVPMPIVPMSTAPATYTVTTAPTTYTVTHHAASTHDVSQYDSQTLELGMEMANSVYYPTNMQQFGSGYQNRNPNQ